MTNKRNQNSNRQLKNSHQTREVHTIQKNVFGALILLLAVSLVLLVRPLTLLPTTHLLMTNWIHNSKEPIQLTNDKSSNSSSEDESSEEESGDEPEGFLLFVI
jgi:hypothetical protein